eukprot:CAMPEP_0118963150 /NCGR_PEP_ID=MMETSP1173-20130426/1186_1 /TAXON_ID=1034831 /ORGANISM="Rhizochromulina marina cf, Strain CCMP1243" /LENGTH=129 /DNA_ID=CAMNT_0006911467 /DNA_START=9 /DNA_END=398 /DNA_ORIENTATION=+
MTAPLDPGEEEDDFFGDGGSEDGLRQAELSAAESRIRTLGFQEGVEAGKERSLQEGFDEGYAQGFAEAYESAVQQSIQSCRTAGLAALPAFAHLPPELVDRVIQETIAIDQQGEGGGTRGAPHGDVAGE